MAQGMLTGDQPIGLDSQWFSGDSKTAYANLKNAGYNPVEWGYHFSNDKVDRFVHNRWKKFIEIPR